MADEGIIDRMPKWCDGLIIAPVVEKTEIVDYTIYPIKRSKEGRGYYFSKKWRELEIEIPPSLTHKYPCVVLRSGTVHRVSRGIFKGRYITIELGGEIGRLT
jgi:hypothetical protein